MPSPKQHRLFPLLIFLGAAFTFSVTMIGTTMPTPLYPIYQDRFGFSDLMITIIFAAYAFGVIAALVLTGRWSDQIGRRPLLFAGLACSIISDLVFLQADGLAMILTGRVLSGLSAGIFTGTATVAVIELAPPHWREKATFFATAANTSGLRFPDARCDSDSTRHIHPVPHAVHRRCCDCRNGPGHLIPRRHGRHRRGEPCAGEGSSDVRVLCRGLYRYLGAGDRPGIDGEHDQPEDDRDHFRRGDGITGGAGFGIADSAGTVRAEVDLSRFSAQGV